MSDDDHYLKFENVSKVFPGVKALDDVSFGVREGSVHALVGENGAGKSTLLKVLSGAYTPSSGAVSINGECRSFANTSDAIAAGVAIIYQELHLVSDLSVAENLYLGHLPARAGFINRPKLRRLARHQLDVVGENISPSTKTGMLPIAQRQMVEIAKALTRGAKIIAFDEPTSSLSDKEVRKLFSIIQKLKAQGHVILYVSHRLDEIFEICDSATVLRDGKLVTSFASMDGLDHDVLVKKMVGRKIESTFGYAPRPFKGPALEAEAVLGPGLRKPVSLAVQRGEILGLFGLVGAGRSELLRILFGAVPMTSGTVTMGGRPIRLARPADAIREGIVLCPEDRKKEGIMPVLSVLENVNISARPHHAHAGFFLRRRWELENSARQIAALRIKVQSPGEHIANLSGGNQQKAVLARWLSVDVNVLLLDEPTRGIDVGAKQEIYDIIHDLASKGIAVIIVSSELPEVLGVADRVLVMREGVAGAAFSRSDASQEKVLKEALWNCQ